MPNYKPKTLMLTQKQIASIEMVIAKMKDQKLDVSLSSIVRILIDDHLDAYLEKFNFFKEDKQMELPLEGGDA